MPGFFSADKDWTLPVQTIAFNVFYFVLERLLFSKEEVILLTRGKVNAKNLFFYANPSDHSGTGFRLPDRTLPGNVRLTNHKMYVHKHDKTRPNPVPVSPGVVFKDIPFYEVLSSLLKPASLVQVQGGTGGLDSEAELRFFLSPSDLSDLDKNGVEVQLRIGCLQSCGDLKDKLPFGVNIRVNYRFTSPIDLDPKGIVNISKEIQHSSIKPQIICVSWSRSVLDRKPYVFGVFLVRKLSANALIKRLADTSVRNPDHTNTMIKRLMCNQDSEVSFMSLKSSLMCPLGKIKMQLPCRAITCTHLQCFDATLYVRLNEKKPKWVCPICDKPANFKSLEIDGLFLDVIKKVPPECTEVEFQVNVSWTPMLAVKKVTEIDPTIQLEAVESDDQLPTKKKVIELISLDAPSDIEELPATPVPKTCTATKRVSLISIDESPVMHEEPFEDFLNTLQPGQLEGLSSVQDSSVLPSSSSEVFDVGHLSTTVTTVSPTSTSGSRYYQGADRTVTLISSSSVGQCSSELIRPNYNPDYSGILSTDGSASSVDKCLSSRFSRYAHTDAASTTEVSQNSMLDNSSYLDMSISSISTDSIDEYLDIASEVPPEGTDVEFYENASSVPHVPTNNNAEIHQTNSRTASLISSSCVDQCSRELSLNNNPDIHTGILTISGSVSSVDTCTCRSSGFSNYADTSAASTATVSQNSISESSSYQDKSISTISTNSIDEFLEMASKVPPEGSDVDFYENVSSVLQMPDINNAPEIHRTNEQESFDTRPKKKHRAISLDSQNENEKPWPFPLFEKHYSTTGVLPSIYDESPVVNVETISAFSSTPQPELLNDLAPIFGCSSMDQSVSGGFPNYGLPSSSPSRFPLSLMNESNSNQGVGNAASNSSSVGQYSDDWLSVLLTR